jgi:hypothetical protein
MMEKEIPTTASLLQSEKKTDIPVAFDRSPPGRFQSGLDHNSN